MSDFREVVASSPEPPEKHDSCAATGALQTSWGLLLAMMSIVALSVFAYIPAVDNFFISDDFTLLSYVKALDQSPLYILEAPSEFFRLVSYLYFWACFSVFGLNPQPYYWAGIALGVQGMLCWFCVTRGCGNPRLLRIPTAAINAPFLQRNGFLLFLSK